MHILLVEDDDFLRKVYADRFSEAGYAVTGAEDGEMALDLLRAQTFDLVLCDVLLPKMDGLTMLAAARTENRLGATPVVMLTNIDDAKERQTAAELGVKEYFLKSVMNIDELVQLVRVIAPLS
jgi:two-component system chemotaxis sensor kinase CheA